MMSIPKHKETLRLRISDVYVRSVNDGGGGDCDSRGHIPP